jgi:hypothetical protein
MFDRNNSLPLSLFLQAERQARLDSLVIKACMRGTMSRLAEWLTARHVGHSAGAQPGR